MIPNELIDKILSYTDLDTCIKMKRLYPLRKWIESGELTMDLASKNGHLEVVKHLCLLGKDCTTDAMDSSSQNGHLEILQLLEEIDLTSPPPNH